MLTSLVVLIFSPPPKAARYEMHSRRSIGKGALESRDFSDDEDN